MLLSALVLSAVLSPAPQAAEAVTSTDLPAGPSAASQTAIDAGLAAFKKRRFAQAEVSFQKALDADPGSAAPYFYLAYTYYKQAEPKRPFHPDKQKSKDMFAKAYAIDPAFRPVWGEARAAKK
jgi:Tfp pilus assembly protein PilF